MLEVAGQAGHGVDVCELYYARIFEGYDPAERTSAETGHPGCPPTRRTRDGRHPRGDTERRNAVAQANRLHSGGKPTGGLEPPTPSLRVMCSTS